MTETVLVHIPVSAKTAEGLADEAVRSEAGAVLDAFVRQRHLAALRQVIAEIKADAREAGVTDAEIDAELEAYNAERRS
jgi:hypothetical protein